MILKIRNLTIQLPIHRVLTPVVRDFTLEVARGEIVGIAGESGSGKSISSLAILGLLPAGSTVTADHFELCGHDLTALSARGWRNIRGRKVAMVFQNPMSALDPCLTVESQLSELVRNVEEGLGRKQVRQRAVDLLEQVGISPQRL